MEITPGFVDDNSSKGWEPKTRLIPNIHLSGAVLLMETGFLP